MPSIASRTNTSSKAIDSQRPFSSVPAEAVGLYNSDSTINRGIPPEQFMYDFQIQQAYPQRPTYRRAFSIVSSINQNIALIAQKTNSTLT